MITHIDTKSQFDEFLPKRAHETDAGADLFALWSGTIGPQKSAAIPTGVCVDIPAGYVGLVFSRSGQGKKEVRMANCVGVIDSGYQGEITVLLTNDSMFNAYEVKQGDRIAQLVILPIITPVFRLVNEFDNVSRRGTGGFGSTG